MLADGAKFIEVEKVDFLERLWVLAYEEEKRLFAASIKSRDSGDNEKSTLLRGMQMGLARMRELEQRLTKAEK